MTKKKSTNEKLKIGLVYGIRPIGGEYFYIGSTKGPIKARLKQHLAEAAKGIHCNKAFSLKVQMCGNLNLEIVELQSVELEYLQNREYEWIAHFRAAGISLTNILISEKQAGHMMRLRRVVPPVEAAIDHLTRLRSRICRAFIGPFTPNRFFDLGITLANLEIARARTGFPDDPQISRLCDRLSLEVSGLRHKAARIVNHA